MTELYVGGRHLFKKTFKTFNEACQAAHTGDTIILPGGTLKLDDAIVLPQGDILIEGKHTTLIPAIHSIAMLASGSSTLKIKDLNIKLDGQTNGLVLDAQNQPFTGSLTLENCQFVHDVKHQFIGERQFYPSLVAQRSGDSLQQQCVPAKVTLKNCVIDKFSLYAQQVVAQNSTLGSINSTESILMSMSQVNQDCVLNNLKMINLSQETIIEHGCLGLGVNLLGAWQLKDGQLRYPIELDQKIASRKLTKMLVEYQLDHNQACLTTYNLKALSSNLVVDGLKIDVDSYQNWLKRKGEYSWFNFDANVKLKNMTIPPIGDNLTNLAGGTIALEDVNDQSKWTTQLHTTIQMRNSQSTLKNNNAEMAVAANQAQTKSRDAMDELNSMIGLQSVKDRLRQLLAMQKIDLQRKKQGLSTKATNRNMIFEGNAGTGKALVNDAVIPTKTGFKKVEEIQVGDQLIGSDGHFTMVDGVYPQGKHTVYRLMLRDGRSVKCNGDHIWTVYRNGIKQDCITRNLIKYLQAGDELILPKQPVVMWQQSEKLPISPFVVGALFASSSIAAKTSYLNLTAKHADFLRRFIVELKDPLYPCHFDVKPVVNPSRRNNYRFMVDVDVNNRDIYHERYRKRHLLYLRDLFTDQSWLANSYHKKLPTMYLTASLDDRLQLLAGIWQSAGELDRHQHPLIKTFSITFAQQIKDLCLSLGMNAKIKVVKKHFEVQFFNFDLLKDYMFDEQLNRVCDYKIDNRIISVKKTKEKANMTCFHVDSFDHLFMANDYVVTHNTTVAKLFAKAMYENGVIESPNVVVAKVSELKGDALGKSGHNMQAAIDKAMGGVFFLDEAYALDAGGNNKDVYILEMQDAFLQAAENNRDNLTMIMAGYTKDMTDFLANNNEGFTSRFPNVVDFPDYTPQEMLMILNKMLKDNGYHLADVEAKKVIATGAIELAKTQKRGSGNGRLMRNYFEQLKAQMAVRLADNPDNDADALSTLVADDGRKAYKLVRENVDRIGESAYRR